MEALREHERVAFPVVVALTVGARRLPGRPNTQPSGETAGGWDVHRYGIAPLVRSQTVVASRSASPPRLLPPIDRQVEQPIAVIHRLDAANCGPVICH